MKKLFLFLLLCFALVAQAQNPTPFDSGIKPRRIVPQPLTTVQIAALPTQPTGTIVYNSTLGFWQFYNGSSWVALGGSPNLQEVTDGSGNNETTNSLIVKVDGTRYAELTNDGLRPNWPEYSTYYLYNAISLLNTSNSKGITITPETGINLNQSGQFTTQLTSSGFQYFNTAYLSGITLSHDTGVPFLNLNNSGRNVSIKSTNLFYDNVILEAPRMSANNESRTIPISVNGEYADTAGNISITSLPTSSDLNDITLNGNFTEQDIEFQAGAGINFNTGVYNLNVQNNTLTANQNLGFPNTSGTLAAKVNGVSANSAGNIVSTLETVTGAGAITPNNITVENSGTGDNTIIYPGYLTTSDFSDSKISYLTPNILSYQRGANYYNIVPPATLTTTRNLTLPDATGTVALTSQIPTMATEIDALKRDGSNANSNIDIGGYDIEANAIQTNNGLVHDILLATDYKTTNASGLYSYNSDETLVDYNPITGEYEYANGAIRYLNEESKILLNAQNIESSFIGTGVQSYLYKTNTYFETALISDIDGDNFGNSAFRLSPEEGNYFRKTSNDGFGAARYDLTITQGTDLMNLSAVDYSDGFSNYLNIKPFLFEVTDNTYPFEEGLFRVNLAAKEIVAGDTDGVYSPTYMRVNVNDARITLNADDKIFLNTVDEISMSANAVTINGLSAVTNKLTSRTTAEILSIGTPTAGEMYYNTTLNTIVFYNGTSWQKVTTTAM